MKIKNFHSYFYFFKKKLHRKSKVSIIKKAVFFNNRFFKERSNGFLHFNFSFSRNILRVNASLFLISPIYSNDKLNASAIELKIHDSYINKSFRKVFKLISLYLNFLGKNVLIKYYSYFIKRMFKGHVLSEYVKNFYLLKVNNLTLLTHLKNYPGPDIKSVQFTFYLNQILKIKSSLKLKFDLGSTAYIVKSFDKLCTSQIDVILRKPLYKTKLIVSSFDERVRPLSTFLGVNGYRLKEVLSIIGKELLSFVIFKKNTVNFVHSFFNKIYGIFLMDTRKNTIISKINRKKMLTLLGRGGSSVKLLIKLIGINILLC
jgi:hypothetical protein